MGGGRFVCTFIYILYDYWLVSLNKVWFPNFIIISFSKFYGVKNSQVQVGHCWTVSRYDLAKNKTINWSVFQFIIDFSLQNVNCDFLLSMSIFDGLTIRHVLVGNCKLVSRFDICQITIWRDSTLIWPVRN